MKTVTITVLLALALLTAYGVGSLTVQFNLFPYPQMLSLKRSLSSSPDSIPAKSYFDEAHYQQRVSLFDVVPARPVDWVFVGDSLIERAEWQELIQDKRVANRGINGDRAPDILKRLSSIVSTQAGVAFLMLGVNDLFAGASVASVVDNYEAIVDELLMANINVVIQSTLLTAEHRVALNQGIQQLNEQLYQMAQAKRNVQYIDLNALLASEGFLNPAYTVDGIHLRGLAYVQWTAYLTTLSFP